MLRPILLQGLRVLCYTVLRGSKTVCFFQYHYSLRPERALPNIGGPSAPFIKALEGGNPSFHAYGHYYCLCQVGQGTRLSKPCS